MNKLLEIKHLETAFRIKDDYFNAVDDVSLDLYENEVLAIVGESGCGKSTLATSVMGLHNENLTKSTGEIIFNGENILNYTEKQFNQIREKDIAMIFQDPLSSLNPLQRIGKQIEEALVYHTDLNAAERSKRVLELIEQVGIEEPVRAAKRFPHELSGGMRQRVVIAIALACNPKIIIADEPTTALDVTIQAQILDLLKDLQQKIKAGVILITHDLGVVAEMADRVAVMYSGQLVELGTAKHIFEEALHPYTRSLLKSIPQLDSENHDDELYVIEGMVPPISKINRQGCRFAPRIPWVPSEAHESEPVLHEVTPGHFVRCSCYKNFEFKEEA